MEDAFQRKECVASALRLVVSVGSPSCQPASRGPKTSAGEQGSFPAIQERQFVTEHVLVGALKGKKGRKMKLEVHPMAVELSGEAIEERDVIKR
jgi:hypothetical protein